MNELTRCKDCIYGTSSGKDYFGAGAIICHLLPQEYRKEPDSYCGSGRENKSICHIDKTQKRVK